MVRGSEYKSEQGSISTTLFSEEENEEAEAVLISSDGELRVDGLRVGRGECLAVPCLKKKAKSLWEVDRVSNLDGFFATNHATESGRGRKINLMRGFIISTVHSILLESSNKANKTDGAFITHRK
jgi:hypothetical protein